MNALFLLSCAFVLLVAQRIVADTATVTVHGDLPGSHFEHFWKESIGSGHALLGTRSDWQEALRRVKQDLDIKRVRMHGIFDDDMSVVLPGGRYEFYNVDVVYDALLSMGIRPIVELSFMPGLIANCSPWVNNAPPCQYVMHYDGIVMPPANFQNWTNLVNAFATHLVARYGIDEVRQWHFEVWNELWGMPYEPLYTQLYAASREGLKAVDQALKIGGPATMQCQFVGEFTSDFAGRFDFVSTHLYPTDPNCTAPAPEASHFDCFANTIKTARSKAPSDAPFFLTEYNAGLFNKELLFSSYAAAFVLRNVPLLHGVLDIWSYWTFSDIFEENGMHSAPFEGFNYGIQTLRGVKKPVYRAFELLNGASNTILKSSLVVPGMSDSSNASVAVFATTSNAHKANVSVKGVAVFLTNFAPSPAFPAPNAVAVNVTIVGSTSVRSGCPSFGMAHIIDANHANPWQAWTKMGSPAYPTADQLMAMKKASEVGMVKVPVVADASGNCAFEIQLAPFSAVRVDL